MPGAAWLRAGDAVPSDVAWMTIGAREAYDPTADQPALVGAIRDAARRVMSVAIPGAMPLGEARAARDEMQ